MRAYLKVRARALPARPGLCRRPGCLNRARVARVPCARSYSAVPSHPGARTATPRTLRWRLVQGHPAVADLGGPERLAIQPRSVRRRFATARWARLGSLGFEPKPGERLRRDLADTFLFTSVFHLCCCLCHLLSSVLFASSRPLSTLSLLWVSLEPISECFSLLFISVSTLL